MEQIIHLPTGAVTQRNKRAPSGRSTYTDNSSTCASKYAFNAG